MDYVFNQHEGKAELPNKHTQCLGVSVRSLAGDTASKWTSYDIDFMMSDECRSSEDFALAS